MNSFHSFPASAANTLVEGYCDDFVQLAASLAQTLEQVSMRGLQLHDSRPSLERVERGMRDLADAIADLLRSMAHARPAATPAPSPQETRDATADTRAPAQGRERPASPSAAAPGGASGNAEIEGNCVIQGSTDSMPLVSVFQFITRMRKTGTLRITHDGGTCTFGFTVGRLESCTTPDAEEGERLSDILAEHGYERASQIAKAEADATPRTAGATLVRSGLITEAQLDEALRGIAQRTARRITKIKVAEYDFYEPVQREGGGRRPARREASPLRRG